MSILFTILGVIFALFIAFLFSFNRKAINYKKTIILLVIQIVIVLFMMNTTIGINVLKILGDFFEGLINISKSGIDFVFGGLINKGGDNFFINTLLPLVFISVLISILNFFKILPFLIKYIGIIINKITHMGKLESYFAISTSMLGQPEVFLTIKNIIPKLSKQRLYTISTSAMSAVSMAMLGSYMQMLEPKYVVTAVMLNIFSALVIASVINPYEANDEELEVDSINNLDTQESETLGGNKKKFTFFQIIGDSAIDGFKMAITVAIMLLAFISLMKGITVVFNLVGLDFKELIGYIFAPIALLIGIPWNESIQAGSVMATKLITNEFVAMLDLQQIANTLTTRTQGILSVYLVSFANFGTIGIIVGAIKGIDSKQGDSIASFALRLLLGSTLASIISASMIGLVL